MVGKYVKNVRGSVTKNAVFVTDLFCSERSDRACRTANAAPHARSLLCNIDSIARRRAGWARPGWSYLDTYGAAACPRHAHPLPISWPKDVVFPNLLGWVSLRPAQHSRAPHADFIMTGPAPCN